MKPIARLACLASIVPLTATAAVDHPVSVDLYAELLRYRVSPGAPGHVAFDEAALGTPALLAQLLVDPRSPYSDIQAAPAFANAIWWPDFVDGLQGEPSHNAVLQTMQWQLGLTKARPGIDVDVTVAHERAYGGREVAANALKAGIPASIFVTALDRHPSRATIAAKEAVAIQLLGEQMAGAPPERWPAMAIRADIYQRYTAGGRTLPAISDDDADYLMRILSLAIRTGAMSIQDGVPQLPAAYRVARMTAAYKDRMGYFSSVARCHGNAPAPDMPLTQEAMADEDRLCSVAATDRGVLGWYRYEGRREHERLRRAAAQIPQHDKTGLLTLLGVVMPLMDLAAFVEFAEAAVARELAEESIAATSEDADAEAEAAMTRSANLTCGLRAP